MTRSNALLSLIAAAIFTSQVAHAQQFMFQTATRSDIPLSSGCKLEKDLYTCDQGKFEQALAAGHTVAVETGPTDAPAQAQLPKLIAKLGKTVAPRGEADLTFLLVPIDQPGVSFNTGDQRIATLRIFAKGEGEGRGNLVWAENYSGPSDLPWFAVVNNVIGQFKSRFHIK